MRPILTIRELRDAGKGAHVHQRICREVDQDGGATIGAGDDHRHQCVTHMGDARISEHSLDVPLDDGDHIPKGL